MLFALVFIVFLRCCLEQQQNVNICRELFRRNRSKTKLICSVFPYKLQIIKQYLHKCSKIKDF